MVGVAAAAAVGGLLWWSRAALLGRQPFLPLGKAAAPLPNHPPPQLPPPLQAAFECMDELLDRCYDRVDAAAFIQHLESGLRVRRGARRAYPAPRKPHVLAGSWQTCGLLKAVILSSPQPHRVAVCVADEMAPFNRPHFRLDPG